MKNRLTQEMQPSFQGVLPATIATLSKNGFPNLTYISQVFYIDDNHVALSNQFFNKTWKNLQDNPRFSVVLTCPETFTLRKLELLFKEDLKDGDVFDQINMVFEAMKSMFSGKAFFNLQSALVCEVLDVKIIHSNV